MLKRSLFIIFLLIMVIVGCIKINIINTKSLSANINEENNYDKITEEFGEDFSEFLKDKAVIKIYSDNENDKATVQIGNGEIKLKKDNFIVDKFKSIGNSIVKKFKKIKNTLKKITKNTDVENNNNDEVDAIVDDFIQWLKENE